MNETEYFINVNESEYFINVYETEYFINLYETEYFHFARLREFHQQFSDVRSVSTVGDSELIGGY